LQEEIENRTVNLAITTTRLGARAILSGLRMYLAHHDRVKNAKRLAKPDHIQGEQTVKELIGQNQGVTSIPLDDFRIKDFSRAAQKYGVDFAVVKDKSEIPAKYTVFFKARDTDALTAIMKDLTAKQLNKEKTPSLLKQLHKLVEKAATIPAKAHHQEQEHSL